MCCRCQVGLNLRRLLLEVELSWRKGVITAGRHRQELAVSGRRRRWAKVLPGDDGVGITISTAKMKHATRVANLAVFPLRAGGEGRGSQSCLGCYTTHHAPHSGSCCENTVLASCSSPRSQTASASFKRTAKLNHERCMTRRCGESPAVPTYLLTVRGTIGSPSCCSASTNWTRS